MSEEEEEHKEVHLEWRDYVAVVIAMFETVLVPLLVVFVILIVLLALFLLA